MLIAPDARKHRTVALLLLAALGVLPGAASAQGEYPTRPIRLVVPFGAGGITDVVGRLIGQQLSEELKQSVVVENKPGAGGGIAAQSVAQAEPDGYTLLLGTVGTQVVNRMIYPRLSYDPGALAPVSLVSNSPYVLAVAGLPGVDGLRALAEHARARPGQLNFGSAGHGSSPHLGLELFKNLTSTDIVHVPFKSGGDAVNAALSGQIQIVLDAIPVVMPHVRDGRLRALALTQARRSKAAPDLVTSAEGGMPDLVIGSWNAILVPVATPADRVAKLADALERVLSRPDTIKRLSVLGIETLPTGVEAYRAHVEAETRRWSLVVDAAGIRVK